MNIHAENRDQLINFLKSDLIGPMTDNPNIEFEEIDTSNKIIFENIEATKKLFKDKETGEEILHMPPSYGFNPLKTYTSGILYPQNLPIVNQDETETKNLDLVDLNEDEVLDELITTEYNPEDNANPNNNTEDLESDIDIGAVNERRPNAIAMSFLFNKTNDTEINIELSGGAYKPVNVFIPNTEMKKELIETDVPQEKIYVEDIGKVKSWWVNLSSENYNKILSKSSLYGEDHDLASQSYKILNEIKAGDILILYSDLSIRSIAVAKSSVQIVDNSNLDEISFIVDELNLKTELNTGNEYLKIEFNNFELTDPIRFDELDTATLTDEFNKKKKFSAFEQDGSLGQNFISELSSEILAYLKNNFLSYWPLTCPLGIYSFESNLSPYLYEPDEARLSTFKLWSYIVKSEDGFTIEQIHSEFSENIEKELLNVFLRNCVETGQLKLEDETYSVSLENKIYNKFYIRKSFSKSVLITNKDLNQITDRGYLNLNTESSNFNHCGVELRLRVFLRKHIEDTYIGTIIFENISQSSFKSLSESSLFQSKIITNVYNKTGSCLLPYPESINFNSESDLDLETIKFSMLYSDKKTFAVGHGTSVGWNSEKLIYTDTMPVAKIKPLTPDIHIPGSNKLYDIKIKDLITDTKLEQLNELLDHYRSWIQNKEKEAQNVEDRYKLAADKTLEDCKAALERMQKGLEIIKSNQKALKAFQLANDSIYRQQLRPSSKRNLIEHNPLASEKRNRYIFDELAEVVFREPTWRPFQIAFFLLNIESLVDEQSEDREIVDLLWFPTGGGKTEAYLALIAFNLFYERLNGAQQERTSVIMRYTLRLLTAQQFERACKLICSMEMIRKENLEEIGSKSFSIGIYVGGETSNNTRKSAIANFNSLKNNEYGAKSKFIISKCPWCSAEIGYSKEFKTFVGIQLTRNPDTVSLHCRDFECQFSNSLPIYTIDEDIYSFTPSLLIGTVDKFAMMAWRPDSRSIFGFGSDGQRKADPPSLIIQDELHLISNALGSAVGFYETILERMSTKNFTSDTNNTSLMVKPKIVCSTATIRNSNKQLLGLYGRNKSLIFPPSGLDIRDSFFAVEDEKTEEKYYLGVFTPSLSTQQTQVDIYTGLYLVPSKFKNCSEQDPFWTNVLYFNSIRELQATKVLLSDNFVRRLQFAQSKYKTKSNEYINPPNRYQVEELTSRLPSDEVVEKLDLLFKDPCSYPKDSLRFVLATNIIEVGIDVPRLSLMTILNQPKNTSQYIQVSGRVGRKSETPPLITTIFSPLRPRDRSHYENFKTFHEKLYLGVEPTSVTPFSDAAIRKMLEGAFFMYLSCKLPTSFYNSDFLFPDEQFEDFKILMINRSKKILSEQQILNIPIDRYLSELKTKWLRFNPTIYSDEFNKKYLDETPLVILSGSWVRNFHTGSFQIPMSMRSVDGSSRGQIMKHYNENIFENKNNEEGIE